MTSLGSTTPSGIPSRTLTSLITNTIFILSAKFVLCALSAVEGSIPVHDLILKDLVAQCMIKFLILNDTFSLIV